MALSGRGACIFTTVPQHALSKVQLSTLLQCPHYPSQGHLLPMPPQPQPYKLRMQGGFVTLSLAPPAEVPSVWWTSSHNLRTVWQSFRFSSLHLGLCLQMFTKIRSRAEATAKTQWPFLILPPMSVRGWQKSRKECLISLFVPVKFHWPGGKYSCFWFCWGNQKRPQG